MTVRAVYSYAIVEVACSRFIVPDAVCSAGRFYVVSRPCPVRNRKHRDADRYILKRRSMLMLVPSSSVTMLRFMSSVYRFVPR